MRERIEDLGRIAVLIDRILEMEIFNDENRSSRPKDAIDWFQDMDKNKQFDFIHSTMYRLSDLENELYEVLSIAKGMDALNQPE